MKKLLKELKELKDKAESYLFDNRSDFNSGWTLGIAEVIKIVEKRIEKQEKQKLWYYYVYARSGIDIKYAEYSQKTPILFLKEINEEGRDYVLLSWYKLNEEEAKEHGRK